ncbi:response regulator [Belnapia sp. T6]|uniref:histidine kinase n=1 Tax=Belnapia mucosa TaxID=2804532 RepID=A0ABS1V9H5_9PROT|nr:response regulator [Belnapia mucosa]MBL6458300.1 response regulator [Belnapia mucosa]
MSFPPATRLAMAFMLALVFACILGILWRQDRRQSALREWSLACLLIAIGAAARAAPEMPDWLRIAGPNSLLLLGFGCFWAGARHFRGARPLAALRYGGTLLWLALLPLVLDQLAIRVSFISGLFGLYALLIAWEFRCGMRVAPLPSHAPLIGVFAIFGALCFSRIPFAAWFGFEGTTMRTLPVASWNDALAVAMLACFAGVAVMLVAIARESAERQSNAGLAAARDRADAASRNKSRFLARMSHELRTPLNAVYGMAQVLARDPALGPVQREQARLLVEAGGQLLGIVNDALDLGRVEAGQLDLALRPVPLAETLRASLAQAEATATARGQELRLDLAPDLPERVACDPQRLRQILMSLLGHAIRSSPPGGRVALAAAWGEGLLRLYVTDTGPALPEEPSGEVAPGWGGSEAGEGTGLGLAIAAALAGAMGGSLRHAPGPDGQGNRFTLLLPAPAAEAPEPGRSLRLLVVDDASPDRNLARALLEPAGHRVEEAADGMSALAALQSDPLPDAVLMDVEMRPLDGLAATRMIRAMDGPAARLPVIAITAGAAGDRAACLAAGMDGHLAKPVGRAALLAELARVTAPMGAPAEAARSLHGSGIITRSFP